ncbi:MAG: amidohydrolase, partial [Alicyclobacillaceae bacterium]|nr:amidohydrolase [Alicyclobacillaceae bacterium]
MSRYRADVEAIRGELVRWRRYLHQHPELSFQEYRTAAWIVDRLKEFGLGEVRRVAETGVVARLVGEEPGPCVAVRADMDALPIQEETDLPFRSQNPGVMHACGHDGHMAMVLGVAQVLSARRSQLRGEVRFIFQKAEEVFPGGAQAMIEEGALEGV